MGNCSTSKRSQNYGSPASLASGTANGSGPSKNVHSVIHEGPVLGLCYSGPTQLVTCGDDKRIAILDLKRMLVDEEFIPKYLTGHTKAVNRIMCTGRDLWSCSRDLSIRKWNLETSSSERVVDNAHELNIMALAASTFDNATIISGSRDYNVKCWDVESGTCKATYSTPRNIVTTLEASPIHAGILYQGSEDLFVRVWDTRSSSGTAPVQVISGFVYFPVCMSVHPEGNLLATGCKGFDSVGCTVKLWDLRNTAQPVCEYAGHAQDVVGCAFSQHDPSLLVSTSKDGSIRVWDTNQGGAQGQADGMYGLIPNTGNLNSCLAAPVLPVQDLAISKVGAEAHSPVPSYPDSPQLERNFFAVGAMDGTVTLASVSDRASSLGGKGTVDIFCTTAAYFGNDEG